MAYNLQSLVKILEQILHPDRHQPWILDPVIKSQGESLLKNVRSLKELFENSSPVTSGEVRSLESQLRNVAYDAENAIESHLRDQLLSRTEAERFMITPPDLLRITEEFVVIKKEMMKIVNGIQEHDTASSSFPISSSWGANPKNIVVGLNEDLVQLKHQLMGEPRKLKIIPIVGMGGIGKTTLAQNLYNDLLVASLFDIRGWIAISQSYNLREILLGLLQSILRKSADEIIQEEIDKQRDENFQVAMVTFESIQEGMDEQKDDIPQVENDKLALRLYKTLWGRRYFIVLDDMWSYKVWDDIKTLFPNENNKSRIVVTTREWEVAEYINPRNLHHHMNFLNEVESWNLLRRKVFDKEPCPSELEEVGKIIVNGCKGLPLAIHVVGGVLLKLDRTQECWVEVANDVRSAVANKNEFSGVLSLSYNHLPNHLKPCFLYLSIFPEDHIIQATKLVRLWAAEGFLKPIVDKSLEEAGKVYLKELIDRNLLLVHKQEIKGHVKSYVMHDLLRELCIRKAREEKFHYVATRAILESCPEDILCMPRLVAHTHYYHITFVIQSSELYKPTHSFLYFGPRVMTPLSDEWNLPFCEVYGLHLLRVLDIVNVRFQELPQQVQRLVNLRYLGTYFWLPILPTWICNLRNLQTLVFHLDGSNPTFSGKIGDLLDMPRLRHVKFKGNHMRCHSLEAGETISLQGDLQTLSTVAINHRSFSEILQAIPNLKKLGVCYDAATSLPSITDLTCLSRLEILKCVGKRRGSHRFLDSLVHPPSLKKLTISACEIRDGYIQQISGLPNLEVLKLQMCSFGWERKWGQREAKFHRLRLLLLERLNLVKWIADETHYPRLESLVIRDCPKLEEIPSGIGEIPTLETIEVHGASSSSALESARRIQLEQIELENDTPQVRISAYVLR